MLLLDAIWYAAGHVLLLQSLKKLSETAKQRPHLNLIDSSGYVIETAAAVTSVTLGGLWVFPGPL